MDLGAADLLQGAEIGSEWVFKVKRNADGSIERYKARLFCQGLQSARCLISMRHSLPQLRFSAIRTSLHYLRSETSFTSIDHLPWFINGDLGKKKSSWSSQRDSERESQAGASPQEVFYGLKQVSRCGTRSCRLWLIDIGFHCVELTAASMCSQGDGAHHHACLCGYITCFELP